LIGAQHLPRHLWWVLAGLTIAWGGNWTALKVALAEIPIWTFRSICLAAGAGVLFGVLRLSGQPLSIARSQWLRLALIAFISVTCWNVLVAIGVRMIPSGRAAILAYTMPALAIPLSVWLLGERMTLRKVTGLALGLGGMALLVWDDLLATGGAPLGSLVMLGAACSWAITTILQKKYPIEAPLPALTAWLMLVGGVPMYICALLFETGTRFEFSAQAWLGLGYNVFIAFAFGYWAWIRLVGSLSVAVFSICMLLTPVVGVFSGMLLLGERPNWAEWAALVLVVGSIITVIKPQRGT